MRKDPDAVSGVPRFDWRRDELVGQLRPFDFSQANELTELERRYCGYYRIDLENRVAGVRHQLGYFEALGYRVALHVYWPQQARGTAFVFHGYFDHAGLYGHLIRDLLQQDLAVVIYDLPGHGLSSGDPVAIKSFEHYQQVLDACLQRCRAHLPAPWYAVGQSTGAAVLLDRLLSRRHDEETMPFQRWVLLAPLVRPAKWSSGRILHRLLSPFLKTWRRAFTENSNDSSFIRFVRRHDPLQSRVLSVEWVTALRDWIHKIEAREPLEVPVTIIQGQQDSTVDWRHNLNILSQKFPNAEIHYLPTGRHHLVNEAPELRALIFEIIRRQFAKIDEPEDDKDLPSEQDS